MEYHPLFYYGWRGKSSGAASFTKNHALFHRFRRKRNKIARVSYNRDVEEITLSEGKENSIFVAHLYNALLPAAIAAGGSGELLYDGDRAAILLRVPSGKQIRARAADAVAEVVCIGYKCRFLEERVSVCLSRRERRLLIAALIAADFESDAAYVRGKARVGGAWAVDGFWNFRLGALKEKWERIARYVPTGFAAPDLKKFCAFLAGESANKIYLKGNIVYGADFTPLRRSRLMGEEDVETEIVLSDAGFIYCLGEVEDAVGDFLQKYYAERAIFS